MVSLHQIVCYSNPKLEPSDLILLLPFLVCDRLRQYASEIPSKKARKTAHAFVKHELTIKKIAKKMEKSMAYLKGTTTRYPTNSIIITLYNMNPTRQFDR